jgi:hypothetical protein
MIDNEGEFVKKIVEKQFNVEIKKTNQRQSGKESVAFSVLAFFLSEFFSWTYADIEREFKKKIPRISRGITKIKTLNSENFKEHIIIEKVNYCKNQISKFI